MKIAVLLLSLVAVASAESVCQSNFENFYKVRNETKATDKMTRDEYNKIKDQAMDKALNYLRDCIDIESEAEYHTEALELMAGTYVDKKRYNLAIGTMERIAESEKDTLYYMKIGKIMQQGSMHSEATELLGSELTKTSTKKSDNWEDFRNRVANMPYSDNITDHLSFTNHSSMLVQLLLSTARASGDVQAVAETMAFALNLVPYNHQIRRVVLHYSAPLLDLATIWRVFAMPPGYNYTSELLRDAINGFTTLLPSVVSSSTRNLYSVGDDSRWSSSLRSYITFRCGVDIPKSDYITRESMAEAATSCFVKSSILKEWKEIAESQETTLEAVLSEESPVTNKTTVEMLRVFGGGLLNSIYENAPQSEKVQCDKFDTKTSLELLQNTFEDAAASYDTKEEWGRVPLEDRVWMKWEDSEQFDEAMLPTLELPTKMDIPYVRITSGDEMESKALNCEQPVMLHDCLANDNDIRDTQQLIFNFTVLMKNLGTTLMNYDESHHLQQSPLSATAPGKASLLAFAFEQMAAFNKTLLKSPMRGPFKKVIAVPEAMQTLLSEGIRNISNFDFAAGGSGSGESMVFGDGHFVNYMWQGHRVWLLLPPSHALFSSFSPLETYKKLTTDQSIKDNLLVAYQLSGDAIYVPAGWSYMYINLRASVGYSASFPWGSSYPLHEESKPADRPEPPKKKSNQGGGSVTIGVTGSDEL